MAKAIECKQESLVRNQHSASDSNASSRLISEHNADLGCKITKPFKSDSATRNPGDPFVLRSGPKPEHMTGHLLMTNPYEQLESTPGQPKY